MSQIIMSQIIMSQIMSQIIMSQIIMSQIKMSQIISQIWQIYLCKFFRCVKILTLCSSDAESGDAPDNGGGRHSEVEHHLQ